MLTSRLVNIPFTVTGLILDMLGNAMLSINITRAVDRFHNVTYTNITTYGRQRF